MESKDLFSSHSKIYAAFRPTYPQELYDFIFSHLKNKNAAWDCGTGNGQVAHVLAKSFDQVFATDLSKQQIDEAIQSPNISYSVSKAESTTFPDSSCDLVTVGQALHWFNIDQFYNEVKRVGKKESLLAVWGYSNVSFSPDIDKHFVRFYNETVGPYWDSARRLVEQEYKTVPFPFQEIPNPGFRISVEWSLEQFAGYLVSWSATQKFIKAKGFNPVSEFIGSISSVWLPGEIKRGFFPLFLLLGKIN